MTKAKINDCVFCRKVSVVSKHIQTYVCDDCYEKIQAEKKILHPELYEWVGMSLYMVGCSCSCYWVFGG